MPTVNRRQFLKLMGASTALVATPTLLRAQFVQPRVVVVGGGFAGATVAKYLRMWSNNSVQVTLVEQNPTHVSCILSNLVLNGGVKLGDITFGYDTLRTGYGVNVLQDVVTTITPSSNQVRLRSGQVLEYDRLVVAPGVSFDPVPGLEDDTVRPDAEKLVPHAWIAGPQTLNLQRQLLTLPRRGVVVMTIPPKPYRCPPGPYERACVIADFLKRKKRGAKLLVLDANPGIVAEPHTFSTAFNGIYKNVVEYIPNAELKRVSFQISAKGALKRTAWVSLNGSTLETPFTGDVLNVIPKHKAGELLFQPELGVINVAGRWAGVDPLSYESTAVPQIHILGDSQGTGQPKAGHIANAEAKVCADAVIRLFGGQAPDPAPATNSACYSPITFNTASWLTAVFQYDPNTRTMTPVPESAGEAPAPSRENFEKMFAWAENLFADTFL